jgi:phosphate acyltransferase
MKKERTAVIRIAIDAMGGDHAPAEIIRGAYLAQSSEWQYILVGQEDVIASQLKQYPFRDSSVAIVPTAEVIGSDEAPVQALRRKKNASLPQAVELLRRNEADAVLCAGNTGAFMAAAVLALRTIPGISRPALCPALPTLMPERMVLLLDVGANMDAEPEHLQQYGVMGSLYAQKLLGLDTPRVALLNVGSEAGKGTRVVQEAFSLLQKSGIHFIGNIEARDLFSGTTDVVVCDGFVGNALLKSGEGLAGAMFSMMRDEFSADWRARLGVMLLRPALRKVRKRLDYTEYGGAPLLGVNGICIKSHGSSDAQAISNGIRTAAKLVQSRLLEDIQENMIRLGGVSNE